MRETVRRQSFDGHFFVDNAVRQNGKLVVTRNRSEVCQYFAFFTGTASPQTHAELWRTLKAQFGPGRQASKAFPEVAPANAFVGNVLRLELLAGQGLSRQMTRDGTFTSHRGPGEGALRERGGDQNGPQIVSPSHRCRIEHTRPPEPDEIANRFFSP